MKAIVASLRACWRSFLSGSAEIILETVDSICSANSSASGISPCCRDSLLSFASVKSGEGLKRESSDDGGCFFFQIDLSAKAASSPQS